MIGYTKSFGMVRLIGDVRSRERKRRLLGIFIKKLKMLQAFLT
jgi:hypothetical protein